MNQLIRDYRSAPLSAADRAMLDYSVKLTRESWTMQESDVESLRQAGFADVDILDIAQIVAYFAFANRVADGLGIGVEPDKWEEIRRASIPDE